jgi:hypothetical protein
MTNSTLILNSSKATVRTWSRRSLECIPHGPAQLRESVFADPDGHDYIGDVVYIRRQTDAGSEYGWVREGLAYTNPKVLPRLTLRTKVDAIATMVERDRRMEL